MNEVRKLGSQDPVVTTVGPVDSIEPIFIFAILKSVANTSALS